jgi:hypothetical protein
MLTQPLEIGDQVRRRVVDDLGGRASNVRRRALVVKHDPPERRIEVAAVMRQAPSARAAVQEDERNTG